MVRRGTAALLAALLVSCGAHTASRPPSRPPATRAVTSAVTSVEAAGTTTPAATSRAQRHVFVIVMENHGYTAVIGNPAAPYTGSLARRYGLATNSHGIGHPSLPNYLAMLGGSTFGIASDCADCSVDASNLADQLERAHLTWKAYMEGLPSPCFTGGSSGRYAKKHDPFVYFRDIASNPARCRARVVPLTTFTSDAARGSLPNLSFIAPDLCHDTHDCSVATGDAWLRSFVPGILRSAAWKDGGVIVITYDEDSADNHIPTLVISPQLAAGARSSRYVSHYSLLRGIEDLFGLTPLRRAAGATDLLGAFGVR